jgi:tRNA (cmo5U34)-methyltransferase
MDQIKAHFEQEAREFDRIIRKLIPYYPQMLEALVSSIPFAGNEKIKVIDLGCGTGTLSKMIKDSYPFSTVHCVDIAENMIDAARNKLSEYSNVTYENADLTKYSFTDSYDAVLSSLTLHHLNSDKTKKEFYTQVFHALNADGVFYNADVVLGSGESIQDNYIFHWKAFMQKGVSREEIENTWIKKYREEDRPAILTDQLNWLKTIGFKNIDVIWKYYNFAVYGGSRK